MNGPLSGGGPGRLNQVFLNILIKAKQSIRGEGEIKISTRVIDNHVRIAVESEVGRGTTFTILLPTDLQEESV